MSQFRSTCARGAAPLALALALIPLAGCKSVRAGEISYSTYDYPGVFRITVGQGHFNWWLLQGGVSSVDLAAAPGVNLASAELRIFDDANGNGTFDAGESSKSFQSSSNPNGLSFSNVSISASDVLGWDTERISVAISVTDSAGKAHVWSKPL